MAMLFLSLLQQPVQWMGNHSNVISVPAAATCAVGGEPWQCYFCLFCNNLCSGWGTMAIYFCPCCSNLCSGWGTMAMLFLSLLQQPLQWVRNHGNVISVPAAATCAVGGEPWQCYFCPCCSNLCSGWGTMAMLFLSLLQQPVQCVGNHGNVISVSAATTCAVGGEPWQCYFCLCCSNLCSVWGTMAMLFLSLLQQPVQWVGNHGNVISVPAAATCAVCGEPWQCYFCLCCNNLCSVWGTMAMLFLSLLQQPVQWVGNHGNVISVSAATTCAVGGEPWQCYFCPCCSNLCSGWGTMAMLFLSLLQQPVQWVGNHGNVISVSAAATCAVCGEPWQCYFCLCCSNLCSGWGTMAMLFLSLLQQPVQWVGNHGNVISVPAAATCAVGGEPWQCYFCPCYSNLCSGWGTMAMLFLSLLQQPVQWVGNHGNGRHEFTVIT